MTEAERLRRHVQRWLDTGGTRRDLASQARLGSAVIRSYLETGTADQVVLEALAEATGFERWWTEDDQGNWNTVAIGRSI